MNFVKYIDLLIILNAIIHILILVKKLVKKNFLYYKKLKHPTDVSIEKYKQCKKDLEKCLKLAKKLYFERKMLETSRNMRERWDATRTLINRSKVKNITCPVKTSVLGNHFSTIAEKLNSKLPNLTCEVLKSNNDGISDSLNFSFDSIDTSTMYNTINNLNTKKALDLMIYMQKS